MIQRILSFILLAGASVSLPAHAQIGAPGAGPQEVVFRARLHGYNEVPSISTRATGEFEARVDAQTGAMNYTLSFRNFESAAQQAHVHLGQPGVNGGVSVWLCGSGAGVPPGTQPCPQSSGTITGTIQPSSVVGPAGQGIALGELGELLAAMNVGATYVNVHSVAYPNGEIRGQVLEQSLAEGM